MSHTTPTEAEITRTLSDLKLSTKAKPKSAPVAESWDDEPLSSDEEPTSTKAPSKPKAAKDSSCTTEDKDPITPIKTTDSSSSYNPPNPPPPTPSSPTPFEFENVPYAPLNPSSPQSSLRGTTAPARRPEKTTAVAGRLIAGALGVKAPRRTAEEREYDRAMREKEKKRREEERERERREREEVEKRKRSVWED